MIIVGEKLNSSIPSTHKAMASRDSLYLRDLVVSQAENGADYIDINTAIFGDAEFDVLQYVLSIAMDNSSCGIMIDSTSPEVLKAGLELINGKRDVIINSVTVSERIDEMLPVVKTAGCGIVGMPINEGGIPGSLDEKKHNIDALMAKFRGAGIPDEKVYIDVLVEAIATTGEGAVSAIEAIKYVKSAYPGVNTICGLSNVSFGLPDRSVLNAAFLAAAVYAGLDCVIMNNTSAPLLDMLYAAMAVSGRDEYCMEYIQNYRKKQDGQG